MTNLCVLHIAASGVACDVAAANLHRQRASKSFIDRSNQQRHSKAFTYWHSQQRHSCLRKEDVLGIQKRVCWSTNSLSTSRASKVSCFWCSAGGHPRTYTHFLTYAHAHTHKQTHIHTNTNKHKHIRMHVRTNTFTYARTNTCKYTHFTDVSFLTIFIESNVGEEEVTRINSVSVFGQRFPTTDMSQLKKAG